MFCKKCGMDLGEKPEVRFCPGCGEPVSGMEREQRSRKERKGRVRECCGCSQDWNRCGCLTLSERPTIKSQVDN